MAQEDGSEVFVEFPSIRRVSRVRRDIAGIISRLFSPLPSRPCLPYLISPYFRAVFTQTPPTRRRYARRAIEDREIPITYYRREESFSRSCKKMDFSSFLPLKFWHIYFKSLFIWSRTKYIYRRRGDRDSPRVVLSPVIWKRSWILYLPFILLPSVLYRELNPCRMLDVAQLPRWFPLRAGTRYAGNVFAFVAHLLCWSHCCLALI